MILPYASDNLPARRPIATLLLLAVTFALALLVAVSRGTGNAGGAAQILALAGIVPGHFNPLTLFTYNLFHDSLGHFLVNAFYLWIFGAGIEAAVGRKTFLLLYFAGGALGGLLQWLVTTLMLPDAVQGGSVQNVPIVGASAACATLIGLYAARYYRATIRFVGLPFRAHVVAVVMLFLALEIGGGIWTMLVGNTLDGVAHWAHIGGFVFGLGCAGWMRLAEVGERAYLSQDASHAMQKNRPGAAIRKWETLLDRDPANVEARRELARAWLLYGDPEQAQKEYVDGLRLYLAHNRRLDAAAQYAELRENGFATPPLSALQWFTLGLALEDLEQYALAAEALHEAYLHNPDAPESETALLKTASLYTHRLGRSDEARVLLQMFGDRYPNSAFRALAGDLQRVIQSAAPNAVLPTLHTDAAFHAEEEPAVKAEPEEAGDTETGTHAAKPADTYISDSATEDMPRDAKEP